MIKKGKNVEQKTSMTELIIMTIPKNPTKKNILSRAFAYLSKFFV